MKAFFSPEFSIEINSILHFKVMSPDFVKSTKSCRKMAGKILPSFSMRLSFFLMALRFKKDSNFLDPKESLAMRRRCIKSTSPLEKNSTQQRRYWRQSKSVRSAKATPQWKKETCSTRKSKRVAPNLTKKN